MPIPVNEPSRKFAACSCTPGWSVCTVRWRPLVGSQARAASRSPEPRSTKLWSYPRLVDRRVRRRVQVQVVVVDRAGALALQVEVRVVGQVEDGRLVRRRVVVDPQVVAPVQG